MARSWCATDSWAGQWAADNSARSSEIPILNHSAPADTLVVLAQNGRDALYDSSFQPTRAAAPTRYRVHFANVGYLRQENSHDFCAAPATGPAKFALRRIVARDAASVSGPDALAIPPMIGLPRRIPDALFMKS
jgi:hypothetical protein